MTRAEILSAYDVDANGRITSPGKFEGEPIFAPHFWDCGLSGFSDSDNGSVFTFKITKADSEHTEFPELKKWLGRSRSLRLREDSQGFVHCF
jgi:hypothetical protein